MLWLFLNIVVILIIIVIVVVALVRQRYRVGTACLNCGYSLHALKSDTCPECGDPLGYLATKKEAHRRAVQARKTVRTIAFWGLIGGTMSTGAAMAFQSPVHWVQYTRSDTVTSDDGSLTEIMVSWRQAQSGAWFLDAPTMTVVVTLPDKRALSQTVEPNAPWNSSREPCETWLGSLVDGGIDYPGLCVTIGRLFEETQMLGQGSRTPDVTEVTTWTSAPLGRNLLLGGGGAVLAWLMCAVLARVLVSDDLFVKHATEQPTRVVALTKNGFRLQSGDEGLEVRWKDVKAITAYNVELYRDNPVCMCFELDTGMSVEVMEDYDAGFETIWAAACTRFELPEKWFTDAAFPMSFGEYRELHRRDE